MGGANGTKEGGRGGEGLKGEFPPKNECYHDSTECIRWVMGWGYFNVVHMSYDIAMFRL